MDSCGDGSNKLTLEDVSELITEDEPDVEISSLDEEPGSGRGDNYTSMLYRVRAKGRKLLKNQEWINYECAIIYKILPECKKHREAFKSELLFRNEVVFYKHVWPVLNRLQLNGRKVFNGVPKIYAARADLIAMEDLRVRGFKMADRRKGLEVENVKNVLKALAGFHALSITLRESRPEEFAKLMNPEHDQGIQETLFRPDNEDWYRQYYRVAANNAIKMVSEAFPSHMDHKREEIMAKLQAFLHEDVFFRTMSELVSAQGPLSVFCHGDCWTNNILFQDKPNSDAEAVYLVDFQLTRVGSLALDLANLLYCCTSGVVRQPYMTQLLQHYHSHLMSSLHVLNSEQPPRNPSVMWELLNEEMRRCGRFGLGLALDILPISTCASHEAPNLYETSSAETSEDKHSTAGAPPPGGAECARLMTDLVLELIENEAL
ncbi:hypothetical protein DMN91_001725 [Ooceraea biroi]|uniref:CHK kinase-like domain-containing protein n=1 Tax=Ooceraea biroi TaxID=2015173 RepID=A0A026WAF1_OOCBI|nr:uncharacterized protein LOC105281776 [Ooceraea biroi]EZA52601.1 hypothetical protein X777_08084 [Ooceraea biroi]RLU25568.1 hypothetical protein DMN91_001725 [Ooceraea biroi]